MMPALVRIALHKLGSVLIIGTTKGIFLTAAGESPCASKLPAPRDPHTVYAGTVRAALFRSRDGGATWSAVGSFTQAFDGDTWGLPAIAGRPSGTRAHSIAVDANDSKRCLVGIEAGGVVSSAQQWRHVADEPARRRARHSLRGYRSGAAQPPLLLNRVRPYRGVGRGAGERAHRRHVCLGRRWAVVAAYLARHVASLHAAPVHRFSTSTCAEGRYRAERAPVHTLLADGLAPVQSVLDIE